MFNKILEAMRTGDVALIKKFTKKSSIAYRIVFFLCILTVFIIFFGEDYSTVDKLIVYSFTFIVFMFSIFGRIKLEKFKKNPEKAMVVGRELIILIGIALLSFIIFKLLFH